jgi:predicted acylesterase/phospholipase RssA
MTEHFGDDKLDCDIVMKGGITSGVVYPGAIAELARHYRFRAIGGTSAGAIAAAIVAAAEHRRQQAPADPAHAAGFAQVADLPRTLSREEHGELQLMRLFQPDPATRGVFRIVRWSLKLRGAAKLLALPLIWVALPVLPLLGAALIVASVVADPRPAITWIGVAAGVLLVVLGPLAQIARAVLRLPANAFGLCRLGPGSVGRGPALTEWLHEQIQTAAGRAVDGPVLTFADLWGAEADPAQPSDALLERCEDPDLRTVDLQVMTTDLTHGRPVRLPARWYRDGSRLHLDDGGGLVFDPQELRRFFPGPVVDHLEACGGPIGRRADRFPDTWRRFPIGPELPVLVATRMSLSFPVLISAIPLWDYDHDRGTPKRVVFSDGGITSNFPVHFFDSPLPRRPTFGLNLTALPGDVPIPEGPASQDAAVGAPPGVSDTAVDDPRDIEQLAQFFGAVKDAMQNWRDNLQARQPGFRDRMIPIMLGPGEGGMALDMSAEKIADLSARGGVAGRRLVERFAVRRDGPGTAWNQHRLGRFRITMAGTEKFMKDFGRGYASAPGTPGVGPATEAITMPYAERVAAAGAAPYAMTAAQIAAAPVVARAYCATTEDHVSLQPGAPRPRSVVRVVPPA